MRFGFPAGEALEISSALRFPNLITANDPCGEVMLGGLKTVRTSRGSLAQMMLEDCLKARGASVRPRLVYANIGHTKALAAWNPDFRATLEKADIIHADSQAAVFASRLLSATPIPERSATTDFIHDAAAMGAEEGLRFYLLGSTEDVNAEAAGILRTRYPGLTIAGRRHGYFSILDEEEICQEINLARPDVIWTGLSAPLEYDFAVRNRARLRAGWLVTCGGCFNFVTGAYKRAPLWMQRTGFEWLYRLSCEPRRLFWRYAGTNPVAFFLLLTRTRTLTADESYSRLIEVRAAA